jgi:hypothetical protein
MFLAPLRPWVANLVHPAAEFEVRLAQALLVTRDELVVEDGSITRGDAVSRG